MVSPAGDSGAYKIFLGRAVYVLDLPKLLDNIKSAKSMIEGPGKDTLKALTGEMREAIKGDEFESIHRSMFSTSQHAIVGVLGGLQMQRHARAVEMPCRND